MFLVFIEVLFALPELIRPAFPLGYQRSALILAIGFTVGAVMGGGLTRLLRSRIGGSLVIPIKSWHLDVGLGIPFLLWAGVPYLLSRVCTSLGERAIEARTVSTAVTDCFLNVRAAGRFEDGLLFGILIWSYLWAIAQERSRKGQLIIAVHSARRWLIRGWPITDTLLALGFAIFLVYVFYRIFILR